MTEKALSEMPPNAALRAFGRAQVVTDDGGIVTQLRNAIAKTVREIAFIPLIGGDMAKPGDVRLWEHGLGDAVDPYKVQNQKNQNLCHPDINNDERCANILGGHDGLGAKRASAPELARFLQFCRNRTQEECLGVWNVAQSLMANVNQYEKDKCESELRKAPFWPVNNGKARSIDGEIPLVAVKPRGLPRWLRVDVVDKEFMDATQEETKRRKGKDESWKNTFSNSLQPPEKRRGYFDRVLLPHCEKLIPEDWQKIGWEILELAFKWGKKDGKSEPFVIEFGDPKPHRAEIFHLPVGKGARKWVPAWQCYASAAWGGPKVFDKYFVGVEDRFVLSSAGNWKIDINDADKVQWKKLLSWLGCSWGWKMVRTDKPYRNRNFRYTEWHEDFYFEHFDEMFEDPQKRKVSDCAPLLNVVTEMYGTATEMKASYSYYSEKTGESSALRQLKGNEWLPCKKSLIFPGKRLFKPGDAYLPGFGLDSLLPEVDNRNLDSSVWDAIKETLKKLGVKDGISKEPKQLIDYMNQLSELSGKNRSDIKWAKDDKGRGKIARAAKGIFSAYKDIENHPHLTGDVMVPCLRHTPQGEEVYFQKASGVCWADESYFDEAEVRRKILNTDNLHVFFRFLQDGEAFGLDKLSEHLRLEPQYGNENPDAAGVLRERYDSRRVGMAKATGQKLPEQLEIVAFESIALNATAHAEIEIPKIKFWKWSEREVAINVAADMWQGLAAALGEFVNGSQYKPDFELLLKGKTWKSFLDRLRDDYGLTEESIQEVNESAPSEDGDASVAETDSDAEPEVDSDTSSSEPSSPNDGPHRHTPGSGTQGTTPPSPGPGNNAGGNRPQPEPQPAAPKIKVVPDYHWAPERGGARNPGVSNDAGGEREAPGSDGKRGERALLQWLKDEFGADNVTNMNEQSPNNPGYDILVVKNGEEHYYECKSFAATMPPRRVSMTKAQFEKAKSDPKCYWLCVIYDVNADTVQMLEPRNPVEFENEPVITEYKIDLTRRIIDAKQHQ